MTLANRMKFFFKSMLLGCLLVVAQTAFSGEVLTSLPESINPQAKYLFFLHGHVVELKGAKLAETKEYGFYEYEKILNTLAGQGFVVISEERGSDTKIKAYAKQVKKQVKILLNKGVAPGNITVAGFSKGGKITLVTSSLIGNEKVNYVVLAGCVRKAKPFIKKFELDLKGRVLSIVDKNDDTFTSCERMFQASSGGLEHKEIILKDGRGHGVFYTPGDIWIKPMMEWIK